MKMTRLVCLVLVMMAAVGVSAQDIGARQWVITLSVFDDAGLPVTNAQATAFHSVRTLPDEEAKHEKIIGATDANGNFAASHSNTVSSLLRVRVEKPGYYPVDESYEVA